MTEETEKFTEEGNPIDATPETPGEIQAGDSTTSTTESPSEEAPATAPTETTPPVIPTELKETFLQKVGEDAEAAYHWLVAELHKIYTAL